MSSPLYVRKDQHADGREVGTLSTSDPTHRGLQIDAVAELENEHDPADRIIIQYASGATRTFWRWEHRPDGE